jgi:hypothetical protein
VAEGSISVGEGEALKLIPPFKWNISEVLASIENVDTTLSVTNPKQ